MRARKGGKWLSVLIGGVAILAVGARKRTRAAGYRNTLFWRVYDTISARIDRRIGWAKLPTVSGLPVLVGIRNILRQRNLYDPARDPGDQPEAPPFDPTFLTARTVGGAHNDLESPAMGMLGALFGRNVPIGSTYPEPLPDILQPSPRVISQQLLRRKEFIPATSVNLLVGSWIQFMVKDWFSHGQGDPKQRWEIPVGPGDTWYERPMTILRTLPARRTGSHPPAFRNGETHWWDSSQIYGTTSDGQARRRTGKDGKLLIGEDGRLVIPTDPHMNPALVPGWWLGMDMMATLFILEHNAVCNRLKSEYPTWPDERLFQTARLVISALIAKIHTVEWTPAIIGHHTTIAALNANWWGVAGEKVRRALGRVSKSEVISGIPGSETDHYGVPYSLTEEFTIVYRMHPLTPDDFVFRAVADNRVLAEKTFREIAGPHTEEVRATIPMPDLLYTFGRSHPGALALHNFPRFLQEFQRPDHEDIFMDLGAIDILRARELGVPRYNAFRRLLHLKPAETFVELTGGDNALADEIATVYGGDLERVDLMVGMFAEPRPTGFGFSDTAFRIFILMASRRLNSDRFFTVDFTPAVYTPLGYDWVQGTTMGMVLTRHFPELGPALRRVKNAFQPWDPTAQDWERVTDGRAAPHTPSE
jgi:Animal haem peroxidase